MLVCHLENEFVSSLIIASKNTNTYKALSCSLLLFKNAKVLSVRSKETGDLAFLSLSTHSRPFCSQLTAVS